MDAKEQGPIYSEEPRHMLALDGDRQRGGGQIFLQVKQRPDVHNLRNYPAEITEHLEELLLSGGSALPDPKRKDFYDLENRGRLFFIHISPKTSRVTLLASWPQR